MLEAQKKRRKKKPLTQPQTKEEQKMKSKFLKIFDPKNRSFYINPSFIAFVMLFAVLVLVVNRKSGANLPVILPGPAAVDADGNPIPFLFNQAVPINTSKTAPQSILSLNPGFYRVLSSKLAGLPGSEQDTAINYPGLVNLIYTVVPVSGKGGVEMTIELGDPVEVTTISAEPRKDALVPGDVFEAEPGGIKFFPQ